jgi:Acyclic terpene utilisation family protein AtuA
VLAGSGDVRWARRPEGEWLGTHAYLGVEPIRAALDEGADVVLTGRAADAALFAAPVMQTLDGSDDALAGAITVGHLLECAGQLTGGNFDAPGGQQLSAEEFADLGYPIARVAPDGSAELSILDGTGGRLDRLTATLQLLYEVHDPSRYLTPDAIVDFSQIVFEEIGPRRLHVSGARFRGRPDQLKVSGFAEVPGAIADVEISYAGSGALRRAEVASDVLRLRMRALGVENAAVDLVGVNSVLGPASGTLRSDPPELRVHVTAACDDLELAQAVEDEVYALTVSGPAAGAGLRSEKRFPRIEVVDGLIDRELVPTEVVWG